MFEKMNWRKRYPKDAIKIFLFVLFGRRPLTVDELRHSLSIPDDAETRFIPSGDSFEKRIPTEQRITSCGGNFLEIKRHLGTSTSYSYSLNLPG